MNSKEGETDLYVLPRQRDRDGKDVEQTTVIKVRDEIVLTDARSVTGRGKEYFEELINDDKRERGNEK